MTSLDLEPKTEKFSIKLETTQKCINVSVSTRDNDDITKAADIAIEGYLYTKENLERRGFLVSPLNLGSKVNE